MRALPSTLMFVITYSKQAKLKHIIILISLSYTTVFCGAAENLQKVFASVFFTEQSNKTQMR